MCLCNWACSRAFAITRKRACAGLLASPRRKVRNMWSRANLDDCRMKQNVFIQIQPRSVVSELTSRLRRTQDCCFKPLSLGCFSTPHYCGISWYSLGWVKTAESSLTMFTPIIRHFHIAMKKDQKAFTNHATQIVRKAEVRLGRRVLINLYKEHLDI